MAPNVRPFISYAHEDQAAAIQLYGDLRAMGAQPWLDAADLLPGQDWEHAIREALRSATHFVAVISRRSTSKRGYVQRELKQALEILEEFSPGDIFLIPIRLEPVEPRHERLRKLQRVDLFADRTTALEKIAKSLGLTVAKTFWGHSGRERARVVAQTTRATRVEAASRWTSVSVNDLLPGFDSLAERLAGARVDVAYLFTKRGVEAPPPVASVVVAHAKVGMTLLRQVCKVVAELGEWYVQIWDEGISENSITIGAYGYGGSLAARIDRSLLAQLRRHSFTMTKLRKWIASEGIVLQTDRPIED